MCVYIYIYTYTHIYTYVYVYVCVCIYIYIYIYIHDSLQLPCSRGRFRAAPHPCTSPSESCAVKALAKYTCTPHKWEIDFAAVFCIDVPELRSRVC